jgi:Leucine-rich repeat (LRR) protein
MATRRKKTPAKHRIRSLSLAEAEEVAAARIAAWRLDPADPDPTRPTERWGSRTRTLDLERLGLTAVPDGIRDLHDLEDLDLGYNEIKELPSWIGTLTELKGINLESNLLRELPPQLAI